jgi:transposase
MYITSIANRGSPPCILLRESYREGGKTRNRTLANLTGWPPHVVQGLGALLKGGKVVDGGAGFEIVRSLPHGHVAAVLGTLRQLGLEKIIASRPSRQRDLIVALLVARVIDPGSKLAAARGLCEQTASTSLGEVLALGDADEEELYAAMDWLLPRQSGIEDALARRHLRDGTLVLYDVTSSYFEGKTCPLAKFGHPRDGKKDKLQIVFGLLCDVEGRPIAVEVFDGNTGDPTTVASQVRKLRQRFGLKRVVLVGDRGMLTEARLREDLSPAEGLDWITALRAPAIAALLEAGKVDTSLFDQQDLAEVTWPERYPGQRLIVCRNPALAAERARKRQDLLAATEKDLAVIAKAVARPAKPLRGAERIGLRVGKVIGRHKMAKHFQIEIADDSFRYERDQQAIAAEAALDGFYVVRTNLPQETLDAEGTVRAYKGLSKAERAFRSLKTVDLKVRPIHHRLADRVRAHVLLCMLAYYVEWHMRQALAPVLFDDEDPQAGQAMRRSVVAPAQRSPAALAKAATKRTADDAPVHSFQTLLSDLATICRNRIQPSVLGAGTFQKTTQPTAFQEQALTILKVTL